jgi:hypothetical protein
VAVGRRNTTRNIFNLQQWLEVMHQQNGRLVKTACQAGSCSRSSGNRKAVRTFPWNLSCCIKASKTLQGLGLLGW